MKNIFGVILIILIAYRLGSVIFENHGKYFIAGYTESYYKSLENAYNSSQYRQKEKPGIIPDETIFSYAAGAYIRGVDPIMINSEHTPLGKYIIGLSILFLQNDSFYVIPFGIITLVVLWLIGVVVLKNKTLALVPVALFSFEEVFINQIIYAPLLDIIQLPFILLTLYFFLIEYKKKRFFLTSIGIGITMAAKTVVSGILLIGCFGLFLIFLKQYKSIYRFALTLSISALIFTASYTRTFLSGYSFMDFIGFQKWIFLYQQSKLIFPLSFWKLILFNQWQAWWGEMKIMPANDWQITWPIFTLLPFVLVILAKYKKIKINQKVLMLLFWIFIFEAFLSIGVVSSRFLLPLLPLLFVVGVYTIKEIIIQYKIVK